MMREGRRFIREGKRGIRYGGVSAARAILLVPSDPVQRSESVSRGHRVRVALGTHAEYAYIDTYHIYRYSRYSAPCIPEYMPIVFVSTSPSLGKLHSALPKVEYIHTPRPAPLVNDY